MQKNIVGGCPMRSYPAIKYLVIMKLSIVFLMATALHVSAAAFSQDKLMSIDINNESIRNAFKQIELKTDYRFIYSSDLFPADMPVNAHFKNTPVSTILNHLLSRTNFTYDYLKGNTIVLHARKRKEDYITIRGKITDVNGKPIPGTTINVKGTGISEIANSDGGYEIIADENSILNYYFIGFKRVEVPVKGREVINVTLEEDISKMDEVVIIGYGTTTQRLNTGSVSRITAADIAKQPVGNILQALMGKIPGVEISQSSGYASGNFNLNIRGQKNLLNQGNATPPLYIVDGVPISVSTGDLNNSGLNQNGFLGSNSGQSPLYHINPSDIESIEVLKDADATAIYGSRAANGVILITTKKGKTGTAAFDLNFYTGLTTNPGKMKLLNTAQYLEMRKEAFANDGITPDEFNAPDLVKWDQNRYTDWQKELGRSARTYDMQLGYSGGNEFTTFRFSGGYHRDSPPVPEAFSGDFRDQRISSMLSVDHSSKDRRLKTTFMVNYGLTSSKLPGASLYEFGLAPNAPALLNSAGQLNFEEYGVDMPDVIRGFFQGYKANTSTFNSNISLSYQLLKSLSFTANFGYTESRMDQLQTIPKFTQGPNPNDYTGIARYGKNNTRGWITEPRINYSTELGKGNLQLLLGATLQSNTITGEDTDGRGFVNDNLLEDLRYAQSVFSMYKFQEYKFQGYFSRINYNLGNRYIFNLSGRRDGSSRFRGGDQMGNFWSAGAAWVFSETEFIKDHLPFLSFGKLRGSIGTTGSAAAGDYQYLKLWQSSQGGGGYDGSPIINLIQPENPGFKWQVNKKMEAALEIGLLDDRLSLIAGVYQERNHDMLVNNALPGYTGFQSVVANIPGVLQNRGFELSLNTVNIRRGTFNWTTSFNFSLNRNKLLSFPGLENSSYADQYLIGQPSNIYQLLRYTGLDAQTGLYTFEDKNGNGMIEGYGVNSDRYAFNLNPDFMGAMQHTISWANWSLAFSLDYKKQKGFYPAFNRVPGGLYNQPVEVLSRWRTPGDLSQTHRYTTNSFDLSDYRNSDASITDASYVRLQNVSLSYNLPQKVADKIKAKGLRIYAQGQNLVTFTSYKGQDATNPSLDYGFIPQRIFTSGLQLTF
ncbi:SusC/RagA family TonB-linked outer membrane protein [Pedobacter sp. AW31-3R]|uniref:SusC/RagA family TonB-linked outer membrane protein n=1 Tax=Pedobacter sp. AW31-3R TaxID=3445781 RepID=UPI003FA02314